MVVHYLVVIFLYSFPVQSSQFPDLSTLYPGHSYKHYLDSTSTTEPTAQSPELALQKNSPESNLSIY